MIVLSSRSLRSLAIVAVIASTCSVSKAAMLVIDDFEKPVLGNSLSPGTLVPVPQPNPVVIQSASAPGIIGGQRDIYVHEMGGVAQGDTLLIVGFNPGPNTGYFDANGSADRTDYYAVQYDGIDVENGGALNDHGGLMVDLTDGFKNNQILIRFANSQVPVTGLLNLCVEITSASGTSKFSGTKSNNVVPGVVENYLIPFSSFTAGADFQHVTSMMFRFNDNGSGVGARAADFQVDLIAAVPEPGSILTLGLGAVSLIAVGCYRRKKRELATRGNSDS